MIFSFDIFFYIAVGRCLTIILPMKLQYELEYNLNCSAKILFQRLSTPEGLGEWFADEIKSEGNIFTFRWGKTESKAVISAIKENKQVRFDWIDEDIEKETGYFEFKITIHDLTGDLALLISDFAEPDEKEDAIYLWDTQINDLKRILGI